MDVVMQNNVINNSFSDGMYMKNKPRSVSTLDELIKELHSVFEADSVNVEYVHQLMANYKSNPSDWRKFAKFDRYRYTRNLVDEGNGKFNLMIVCWGEGHGSAIHDHSDAHCFMKVLQGALCEIRFAWPETEEKVASDNDAEDPKELKELARNQIDLNEVCYINDSLGLHRVENPSNVNPAVSLHLYCPPFDTCTIFNQRTGQRSRCKVTFWSKFGGKRDREYQAALPPEDN